MNQLSLDAALDAAPRPDTRQRHVITLANGATVTLFNDQIICRTKSGQKLHRSAPGSSVAYGCGHWFKTQSTYFQVQPQHTTPAHVMCEKCFPEAN